MKQERPAAKIFLIAENLPGMKILQTDSPACRIPPALLLFAACFIYCFFSYALPLRPLRRLLQ